MNNSPTNASKPTLACLPLLLLGMTAAQASTTSAELRVAGSIAPAGSCEVKVGDGRVDFGAVELDPDPTKPTSLEERVKMTVTCTVARRYALIAGSSSSTGTNNPNDFGLVSTDGRSSVGSLFVRLDSSSDHIEGVRAYHTGADASLDLANATWGPSSRSTWPLSVGTHAIGFVSEDGSYATPSPIRNFDTYLLVHPMIKPANELDHRDEIAFYGDLGFEIRYF